MLLRTSSQSQNTFDTFNSLKSRLMLSSWHVQTIVPKEKYDNAWLLMYEIGNISVAARSASHLLSPQCQTIMPLQVRTNISTWMWRHFGGRFVTEIQHKESNHQVRQMGMVPMSLDDGSLLVISAGNHHGRRLSFLGASSKKKIFGRWSHVLSF